MLHGADHGLDEAEGVEARLLSPEVSVPEVGDGPVAGLELQILRRAVLAARQAKRVAKEELSMQRLPTEIGAK